MLNEVDAIRAQALIHHAYYLGLQLRVAMEHGPQVVEDWTFGLFRRQHNKKFLSSFPRMTCRPLTVPTVAGRLPSLTGIDGDSIGLC